VAGQAPDLDVASDGTPHLVWQAFNRFTRLSHIKYSQASGGEWTLAEILSDLNSDAIAPAIVVAPAGEVYVAWNNVSLEVGGRIELVSGQSEMWSLPYSVSPDRAPALGRPALALSAQALDTAWQTGGDLPGVDYRRRGAAGAWQAVERLSGIGGRDVALASNAGGEVWAVWSEITDEKSGADIYYRVREGEAVTPSPTVSPTAEPTPRPGLFIPLAGKSSQPPTQMLGPTQCCRTQPQLASQTDTPFSVTQWASPTAVITRTRQPSDLDVLSLNSTLHLAWEEGGQLYHAYWGQTGWTLSRVGYGEQPALAADPQGRLHMAFVNQFRTNFEVYHVTWQGTRWSLPENISNTDGYSTAPDIGIARDGSPYVVWSDGTPERPVIYLAARAARAWRNGPLPHGRGTSPALAFSLEGRPGVAWHDQWRPGQPSDIYLSVQVGEHWTLPESISDSRDDESMAVAVASDPYGDFHVVWQESSPSHISYVLGQPGFWTAPVTLSTYAPARAPDLAVNTAAARVAVWDDADSVWARRGARAAEWEVAQRVAQPNSTAGGAAVDVGSDGVMHVAWLERRQSGWSITYSYGLAVATRVYLPYTAGFEPPR
jgi:hypothetical protein